MKFKAAIAQALADAIAADPKVLVCGQLVKYGQAGDITLGLPRTNLVEFPCAEALQNSAAVGLALAGHPTVMIHERWEFVMYAPDALLNYAPIWQRFVPLPLVIVAVVGKRGGQGPQQSKDFTHWFAHYEGWQLADPRDPQQAYNWLRIALTSQKPTMYVARRELFELETGKDIAAPTSVGLCGAGKRFEDAFYGD